MSLIKIEANEKADFAIMKILRCAAPSILLQYLNYKYSRCAAPFPVICFCQTVAGSGRAAKYL